MLGKEEDTIAAIATPAGVGGVGIVRISGSRAISIAARLSGRTPEQLPDRQLVRAVVRKGEERLDDVLVVAMRRPHSYTGEDVAEIQGHGGPINMARLLRAVLNEGARSATAGEFTRRALQNGQLDLVRAEALIDVIEATSERSWRLAQKQLAGELGAQVRKLRDVATDLLAEVEAHIDFPEEGLGEVAEAQIDKTLAQVGDEISLLIRSYELGRALKEGVDVALVGPTNSGKSSLFNRLVGTERAVVDSQPGTTRDYIEERIVIDGLSICVIDTAGTQTQGSAAEHRGIQLGRRRVEMADVVVILHPADGPAIGREELAPTQKRVDVWSKCDLGPSRSESYLEISAETGQGLDELRRKLITHVGQDRALAEARQVITSERQRNLLSQAWTALQRARKGLGSDPVELTAIDLRDAATALAAILGEAVGDEVLDKLFARFCIGK